MAVKMSPKRPGKKDFDTERMYQKLIPSMQVEPLASEYMSEPDIDMPETGESAMHVNLMELILKEKMEHTMKMLRSCGCERCRSDILACALNQLPSFYAVDESRFPEKITELRRRYEVKAASALILAVQKVKAEPRH